MPSKSHRETRFLGPGQTAFLKAGEKDDNNNRRTRFPGGTGIQNISIVEAVESIINRKVVQEEVAQLPVRLHLTINSPDAALAKPPPVMNIERDELPHIKMENPWDTYTSLRTLERGGEIVAACTQKDPIEMVAVKKLSFDHFRQYARHQHDNILDIIEIYKDRGVLFAITNYTAATLKQVIAIPLPLQELHISATCRQGSYSPPFSMIQLTNVSKVFKGMQYLSRFGIAHKTLDSSKILFLANGCVKIGTMNTVTVIYQLI